MEAYRRIPYHPGTFGANSGARMYARNLERILANYFFKADLAHEPSNSFEHRFRALRGCNLLPRGRERREAELTTEQIAYAVLGSASIQPAWAGVVAIGLARLKPAGGPPASFRGTTNLLEAIVSLLGDSKELVSLMLSSAEGGVNSNGEALLVHKNRDSVPVLTKFVAPEAACRVAVAHASSKSPSDPDEASEILRLHVAADMLRLLSRDFIANELGVSAERLE
jgi:hypothetical protein